MARDDSGPRSDDPGPIETSPVTKGAGRGNINIGNIQGSGIVIGSGSFAHIQSNPRELHEAFDKLQQFMDVLASHETEIADPDEIREAAAAVQAELASPNPKIRVVRRLLQVIEIDVAGIVDLSYLISEVQAIVRLSE